jgi:hypothetical protein
LLPASRPIPSGRFRRRPRARIDRVGARAAPVDARTDEELEGVERGAQHVVVAANRGVEGRVDAHDTATADEQLRDEERAVRCGERELGRTHIAEVRVARDDLRAAPIGEDARQPVERAVAEVAGLDGDADAQPRAARGDDLDVVQLHEPVGR